MMKGSAPSSLVRLNIGGDKFCTTINTLTRREPDSMIAAMFSGRPTVFRDYGKEYVFVDRDGCHFRYILNWLRDGTHYAQLLREAEYYQLLGLIDGINFAINRKKEDEDFDSELMRTDIIKCIQSEKVRLRGVKSLWP